MSDLTLQLQNLDFPSPPSFSSGTGTGSGFAADYNKQVSADNA